MVMSVLMAMLAMIMMTMIMMTMIMMLMLFDNWFYIDNPISFFVRTVSFFDRTTLCFPNFIFDLILLSLLLREETFFYFFLSFWLTFLLNIVILLGNWNLFTGRVVSINTCFIIEVLLLLLILFMWVER